MVSPNKIWDDFLNMPGIRHARKVKKNINERAERAYGENHRSRHQFQIFGVATGIGVGMATGGVHTLSMATRSDIRDPSKGSTYNPLKIAGNLAEITTARVGAAVTHPWAAGSRNAEIDISQWDSFVSGNYQNLKWDYPNH